ncbi:MAG: hypothetical protein ACPGYT_02075 [Nitrospirales bacterium]
MSNSFSRRKFLTLGSSLFALGSLGITPMANASFRKRRNRKRIDIDVSCNARSIRFTGPQGVNPSDASDIGPHPYYGASFVVQGTIYPKGIFAANGGKSGLNADGSPEFPDQVIGTWTCRGWFVGDSNGDGVITPDDQDARGGIFTPAGRFVATTQIYDFDPQNPGAQTMISDGSERIERNVPFKRAVTGGTGQYRFARGEVTQTGIDTNTTGLFNFRFAFDIRRNP